MQKILMIFVVELLFFCPLSVAQDAPSTQQVVQAIQDGQTTPVGCDSRLAIHIQHILEANGRFEYDGDGDVIGLDFVHEKPLVSDEVLPSILYFTELQKLRVSGNLSPNGIRQLSHLSKLTELVLQDTFVDDETFVHLIRTCRLTSLGVRNATKLTEAALDQIEKSTSLTSLSLIDVAVSDATCMKIAKLDTLNHLEIRDCARVSADGIMRLAALPALKTLRLGGMTMDVHWVSEYAPFPALKSLTLDACDVTSQGMETIAKLNLEEIAMFRCTSVNDNHLVPILISSNSLKRLTVSGGNFFGKTLSRCVFKERFVELRFAETYFDDASSDFLAECVHLQRLDLRATRVTDVTLDKIATLEALEYLHLEGTQITDSGLTKLAACTSLRYLNLAQTAVSEFAVQAFQQSHPHCEVDRRMTH